MGDALHSSGFDVGSGGPGFRIECLHPGPGQGDRHQHVGGITHGSAPVHQERIGSVRGATLHRARYGTHRNRPSGCRFGRVEGPPAVVALDHHHHVGEGGDDPIAGRKHTRVRLRPERRFGEDRPPIRHVLPELAIRRGIHDVQPGADHRHRRSRVGASCPQGAGMGRSVDAPGQARNHDDAFGGEVTGQLGRHLAPVVGGRSGTDDGHPSACPRAQPDPRGRTVRPAHPGPRSTWRGTRSMSGSRTLTPARSVSRPRLRPGPYVRRRRREPPSRIGRDGHPARTAFQARTGSKPSSSFARRTGVIPGRPARPGGSSTSVHFELVRAHQLLSPPSRRVTSASKHQRLLDVGLLDQISGAVEVGHGPGQSMDPVESAGTQGSGPDLTFDDGSRTPAHRDHLIERRSRELWR